MYIDKYYRRKVDRLMKENQLKTMNSKGLVQVQATGRPRTTAQSAPGNKFLRGKINGAFVLWLTLFACAVTSTAFFALGYAHSPHRQGSINDPDFWFLVQSSIVQLLGLVVSARLEWKNVNLSKWRWVLPTVIAGVCSIMAIPCYLVAPTEWSSFLSLVAGSTQSFMVWQHLLSQNVSE